MLGRFAFINPVVAKRLNLPESKVASVTNFFITELDQELRAAQHPYIYVRGLGTFTLVLGAIETRLRYFIRRLRELKKESDVWKSEKKVIALQQMISELFPMRRLLKDRRREIKELKNARASRTNHKG